MHCTNTILSREDLSHQPLDQVTKARCTLLHCLPKIPWKPTYQHSLKRKRLDSSHGLIFQGFVITGKGTNVAEILLDGQVLCAPCFASSFNRLLVHGFLKNYIILTSRGRSSQNLHSFQPLSNQWVFISNWQKAAWEHTKAIQNKEQFKGFFSLFYGNSRILTTCFMAFQFFLLIWFVSPFVFLSPCLFTKLCEWCKIIIMNTNCLKNSVRAKFLLFYSPFKFYFKECTLAPYMV